MKTRNYLIAIVIAILLPVVAFSAWGLQLLLENEKTARLAAVEEITRSIALAIDQEIADAEGMLRVLASTEYLRKEEFTPLYQLMAKADIAPDAWITLFDADGRVLESTESPFGTSYGNIKYDWVPAAIALQKPSVSNLREGLSTKIQVVSINVPVATASGRELLLSYVFEAGHFTKLLRSKSLSTNGVVGLFGSDGLTIARNLREKEFIGRPVRKEVFAASRHQYSGRLQNITREGFRAYTTFTGTSRTSWTVAIASPAEEINRPAQSATLYSAFALCIVFGCTILAVTFFARRVTMSFNLAVAAARSLALGKVPQPQASGVAEADLLQQALRDAGVKLAEENQARKLLEGERERLLQSERDARREAENQNNAKDEFLAMLAHELRNPLAPIAAAAQLLKITGRNDKNVQHSSEVIVRQVNHLKTLVDDLLDVSRVTRGLTSLNMEEVDIKSVVGSAVEQARPLIEARSHTLHIHMHAAHTAVLGDKTRLIQVICNLLNNAAKYTPAGGKIALAIEVQGGEVKIIVTDNGIGIEAGLLPNVFELFRQGKRTPDRSQGGLGLGLALVKSIMSLHGGRVEAKSDGPGKGSSFALCLPLIMRDGGDIPAEDNRVRTSAASVRIMVVDDNVDAAQSLANLLNSKGHDVTAKSDAHSAIEHSADDPMAVYILDIGLPDMDGYALARRLRASPATADAVLIALTGYGQAHDKESARAAGFDHHFVKPMDMEALDVILEEAAQSTVASS